MNPPAAEGEGPPRPPLLEVDDLSLSLRFGARRAPVVRRLSLEIRAGEILGLVGESGAGKSLAALAILGLLPLTCRVDEGQIRLQGEDLLALPDAARRAIRGRRVAMVFQEPHAALNPVLKIGTQITEVLRRLDREPRRGAGRAGGHRERVIELLHRVAMPDPEVRIDAYPHQLSGGQCQRAMLAMALAGDPDLLLADEPTTALDVTVQAQILALLTELRHSLGLAVLLITHDLGVVAQTCDRVVVLYAGQVVEEAPVATLFSQPSHPYTRALLAASPRLGDLRPAFQDDPTLAAAQSGPRLETRPSGRRRAPLYAIPGSAPDPWALPAGCSFHPRCSAVFAPCRHHPPPLSPVAEGQRARCFLFDPEVAPA